ncbi:N-acetylmuramoyl-L-alanine amidase [Desulfitobacterium sp.]|uniref:N-acetylmuramoyl-L-alanine amidase n=1 Tax=Desulfitobacterium sp. TaxID=49981 RepID=UPI002B20DFB5|nr:N-acetylmuramoyl-L-alanine amidase [Desulfitobacterium sp.]MEA4901835.1 N-acetylmuramoyl-L-alanine amidase [Desulfitobacterium sp.]
MSNSKLVDFTQLSPNCTKPRNHVIDTITIHCVAGNCTVETIGAIFAPTSRQASSNYGIGSDGRIGQYVDEANRSWCTSSGANDHRAITIEVANDGGAPDWHVSDKALAALIDLCTDICKRNGIKALLWKGDKNLIGQVDKQNMTVHRWFANKSCPGDYLYSKHPYIAAEVNKRLGADTPTPPAQTPTPPASGSTALKVGDIVQFAGGSIYTSSNAATAAQTRGKSRCKVTQIASSGKHPYHLISEDGGGVYGWVDASNASADGTAPVASFTPYLVQVTADTLNIRKGAGTNYPVTGSIKDKGVYTIIEEASGAGATKWGKLKSGAGWISLDYTKKA